MVIMASSIAHSGHIPANTETCSLSLEHPFDFEYLCYGQLTAVKIRYLLTSIM